TVLVSHYNSPKGPSPTAPWYRQALIGATSVSSAVPGNQVTVPIYAKVANASSISGMQFRAVVTPQGAAPAPTHSPQIVRAAGIPVPYIQASSQSKGTAIGWNIGSFNTLTSLSSNALGSVTFTIPASAQVGQVYKVSIANADGSPNLNSQYDFETRSAY